MKIDRLHFYVRNAIQTRNWFMEHLGFKSISSENDGQTQTEEIALNSVYFKFSSAVSSASPVSNYLQSHPSGVVDIAFQVADLEAIMATAKSRGVKIVNPLQTIVSDQHQIKQVQIEGWSGLSHTLIEIEEEFEPVDLSPDFDHEMIGIDHLVLNVSQGELTPAVAFYQALFGFQIQQTFKIQTDKSGLYSQALIDTSGKIQFNINEPTSPTSQIQQFLDLNQGAGIQHLALRSRNLIQTVSQLRACGVPFLKIPLTYYRNAEIPSSISPLEWLAIEQQQILVDCDRRQPDSLLLQIFTQPIFEQPTFFLEFIERRHDAQGFGKGNFQALFEAVEREQISNFQTQLHKIVI